MDSPITKKSRGSRPPFGIPIFIIILQDKEKIKLHLGYKSGLSFSNRASRIQKLLFAYKDSVVNFQDGVSPYKVASRFSIKVFVGIVSIITSNLWQENVDFCLNISNRRSVMQSLIGLSLRGQQMKYRGRGRLDRRLVALIVAVMAAGLLARQYFM